MAIYDSLTILTEEEIGKLYEIPKIDHEDRERFFEITPEDEVLSQPHSQHTVNM